MKSQTEADKNKHGIHVYYYGEQPKLTENGRISCSQTAGETGFRLFLSAAGSTWKLHYHTDVGRLQGSSIEHIKDAIKYPASSLCPACLALVRPCHVCKMTLSPDLTQPHTRMSRDKINKQKGFLSHASF